MAGEGSKCPQCEILKQWLEVESARREYYEKLLLVRVGAIVPSPDSLSNEEEYPSVRRVVTMSALRKAAEADSRNKARVAKDSEKTPEEKLFEEQLNNVKKDEDSKVKV